MYVSLLQFTLLL